MARTSGPRIGAIDDTPIVLTGLVEGLRIHLPGSVVTRTARTVDEFLATEPEVDVVLLDIELRDDTDPTDNVRRLTQRGWPVLIYTQDPRDRLVGRAFRAGAVGLLSKNAELPELAQAITTVAAGEPYLSPAWAAAMTSDASWAAPNLTPREVEAVRLYAAGMKLTSVARRLSVTDDTARTYLLRARKKYEASGRPAATKTELYIRAVEDGLLPSPQAPEPGEGHRA